MQPFRTFNMGTILSMVHPFQKSTQPKNKIISLSIFIKMQGTRNMYFNVHNKIANSFHWLHNRHYQQP